MYTILGISVPVRLFRGAIVTSYKDIASVMLCPVDNLKMMFKRRKDEFIDGKDYFLVKPAHLMIGGCGMPYKYTNQYGEKEVLEDSLLVKTVGMEANNRGTMYFTEHGFLKLVVTMQGERAIKVRDGFCSLYVEVKCLFSGTASIDDINHVHKMYGSNAVSDVLVQTNQYAQGIRMQPLGEGDIEHLKLNIDLRARREMGYNSFLPIKEEDLYEYDYICNQLWNGMTSRYPLIVCNYNTLLDYVRTVPIKILIAKPVTKKE